MLIYKYACILVVAIGLTSCTANSSDVASSSIKKDGESKILACVKNKDYQSKLTVKDIVVEINNETLSITNLSNSSKEIEVNRGFKFYSLPSKSTEKIYNILNEKSCITIKPKS